MKLSELKKEWDNVQLIKVFEVPVIDKITQEHDWIVFDVDIHGEKFIAQHVALNREQEQSNKIAFVDWDIDPDFSLDENLQTLHELCLNAIIDSEFFRLSD